VKKVYGADELRAAIANGELVNYYQHNVVVATGEVVETLVRWRHPQDGMVFPDQFIGVAEAHGLIDDLTRVVLTGALAQANVWQDAGWVLWVAVNVSMVSLTSPDFPNFVAGLAAQAGAPPQGLVLEVTESRLMQDLRAPLEILTQLRDLPFDELKIDPLYTAPGPTRHCGRCTTPVWVWQANWALKSWPKGSKTGPTGISCAAPDVIWLRAISSPVRCRLPIFPVGWRTGRTGSAADLPLMTKISTPTILVASDNTGGLRAPSTLNPCKKDELRPVYALFCSGLRSPCGRLLCPVVTMI
jgi:hypothetical protein